MVTHRLCAFRKPNGQPCGSPPLHGGEFCFMHSPERIKEVQDARHLGGLRRKRESAISSAFLLESLKSIEGVRRLIDLAALDTAALDNSVARNRTLLYAAVVALNALEKGDLEERIAALEEITRVKR